MFRGPIKEDTTAVLKQFVKMQNSLLDMDDTKIYP